MGMEITIKPLALAELNKKNFKDGEGLRIEAIFLGSCSIYAEYNLKIDQKQEDDDVFMVEGIMVFISKESQKHLHHKLSLDFNPNMGYKLSSAEEVYRYNLALK